MLWAQASNKGTPHGGASPFTKHVAPSSNGHSPRPEPGKPSSPSSPSNGKPGSDTKKDDSPGATGTPATIVRPAAPEFPADPEELKIQLSEDGTFRFNFKGQPWAGVLESIAQVSSLSLDWQELPGDHLNLVTQREYTVDESRDVINRHLLLRGYTMLRVGEVLSVVKVDKLDPSMVPRVTPEELQDRALHEFVKVSFPLNWLLAEQAAVELKPMLSPNGKLTALTSTNRLEAIDAVRNLQEINRLLAEEQSGGEDLGGPVREFPLQHARATDVVQQLEAFLGISKSGGRGMPMSPQQLQQLQQAMAKAAQAQKGGAPAKEKPEVHLLANEKLNTVIVQAPPDKMIVIEQTIQMLDRRSEDEGSIFLNSDRMQVYRLAGVDPELLVRVLEETGNLDPTTRLEIDEKNSAIIAYASLADHLTIRTLVDRLDGSSRQFHVIALRKHEADHLAGTIKAMMGADEQKQNQSPYTSYFRYSRGGSQQQTSNDEFSVEADVEYNRLLLRANDVEMKEVENLLVKLGEIPAPGGNGNTIRVIDSIPAEEVENLLERIRKTWPAYSPNKLQIEPSETTRTEETGTPASKPDGKAPEEESEESPPPNRPVALPARTTAAKRLRHGPAKDHFRVEGGTDPVVASDDGSDAQDSVVALLPTQSLLRLLAQHEPNAAKEDPPQDGQVQDSGSRADTEGSDPVPDAMRPSAESGSSATDGDKPPNVRISQGPDGRLVISSDDTEALDLLEELIAEYAAGRPDFKIFKLKHPATWAYGIELMLEEYFEDEQKQQSGSRSRYYDPWGSRSGSQSTDSTRRLSKRRPLKFISDEDTRTILVQGADSEQLKTIEELINLWDQPVSEESQLVRKTQIFQVRYSTASTIAETVKEVYRDLLSENDKSLDRGDGKGKPQGMSYTYVYGGYGDDSKKRDGQSPIRFKGLVSIGVDDVSNQLIVSASEELLGDISRIIETLDEAARGTVDTVQVVPTTDRLNTALLQRKLSGLLGAPKSSSGSRSSKSPTPSRPPSSSRSSRRPSR